ncbi:MAG: asparaginase [Pseudomonadota bacterium]
MTLVPLIETTRGGTLECQHFGAVAVVNTAGQLLASAGDAHWLSFTRSTLKPFQALPFMQAGGASHFQFTERQIAMLCASHNGEPMHVTEVGGMLAKAGVTYKALQCGCHVPYFVELGAKGAPLPYDERQHNCSGKHSGFVAYCVQHGHTLEDYNEPGHPLQRAVRRDVALAADVPEDSLQMGIDGCSAPNYAIPLANLALAYARLASGHQDGRFGESYAQLSEAMSSFPELVSGTFRNDEAFMRAGRGDWVTKVGADGVQAFASKSRGEAFAVRIIDGSKPALFAATVAVLEQLGWLDDAQREALRPWRAESILSIKGVEVGQRHAPFTLTRRDEKIST